LIFRPKVKIRYEDEGIPNEGNLLVEYWTIKKQELIIITISTCLLFLPVGAFFLIRFLKMRSVYLKITDLVEEGNQKEIINIIKDSSKTSALITVMMGIHALADMKSKALEEMIRFFLKELGFNTTMREAFARQRCNYLLGYLERRVERGEEKKEVIDEAETIIPITKIFFVEEEKLKEEKCMITGIRIDVKGDKIVVCPKCRHYAKKELLEKWLEEKETCPICRNRITITDCPEVMIKEKK